MEVFCSIPARSLLSPSYYHSFGVTENYVIFLEQPFKLDILKMATAYVRGVSWASCMSFHGEDKVRPSCLSTPRQDHRGGHPEGCWQDISYRLVAPRAAATVWSVLELGWVH